MKHIKYRIVLFAAFTFVVSACEFGDTNVNPALPNDVSIQAIVPAAQAGMAFAIGGEMVRINGLFMQHFNGINAQQLDNSKYLVKSSDMDGVWRRLYANSLNPLITILRKADEQDATYHRGMARILIAHTLGTLTDGFGDVPYTDALQALDDKFFPAYDSQESVYQSIQQLLDQGIADMEGDAGTGPVLGGDDLLFGGDVAQWVRVAKSLKTKYFIHTTKRDAAAYTNVLNALDGTISSSAEDFEFNFGSGPNEANPQFQFSQDRGGNIEIGQFFFDLLNNQNDPRRSQFLIADPDAASGFKNEFNSGTYYSTINAPVVFMSFAEIKFIEAEAELMGNNDPVAAEAALKEAVTASLQKITGQVDATYVDTYASFAGLTTTETQLERIMTEKYIALYSVGLESWSDFRRTGFPVLTPNPEGNNAFNLNGEIPRRLPYPQTEIDLNPDNVPTISPNFQDRFWWDQ